MFGLYSCGIAGALLAALVLRRGVLKGGGGGFMMELPKYQWPPLKDVAHRPPHPRADLPQARRHDHPRHDDHAVGAGEHSAGRARPEAERRLDRRARSASGIEVVVEPIGFNHDISWRCCRRWPRAKSRSARSRPSIRSTRPTSSPARRRLEDKLQHRWTPADRARLPRLVRVRAAVHLDHRRHPARDQRLEVAAVHGLLSVRPRLSSRQA